MSRWKMSAPDHAFKLTSGICMARDRPVQPEYRCLTNEGLLANSLHHLATANVLIYAITLNPRFLKPALYFIFDKAGGRNSIIAEHKLTSTKGYPCQYKGILRALGMFHHTVLYCITINSKIRL